MQNGDRSMGSADSSTSHLPLCNIHIKIYNHMDIYIYIHIESMYLHIIYIYILHTERYVRACNVRISLYYACIPASIQFTPNIPRPVPSSRPPSSATAVKRRALSSSRGMDTGFPGWICLQWLPLDSANHPQQLPTVTPNNGENVKGLSTNSHVHC